MTIDSPLPVPEGQHWNADRYAENARFVADLGSAVLNWLAPQPGERILDLGCGDGHLTRRLADLGVTVVGVDAAPDMLVAARKLGLDVRLMNGHELDFEQEFDAVFSNAALHWMRRPEAVLASVKRALRPGGRFVGEFGGHANVAAIQVALLAVCQRRGLDAEQVLPWYFPTADEYRDRLQNTGFIVDRMETIPRPTALPTSMRGWMETFAGDAMGQLPSAERGAALDEIVALLGPVLRDASGQWVADYVRLRFAAHLS